MKTTTKLILATATCFLLAFGSFVLAEEVKFKPGDYVVVKNCIHPVKITGYITIIETGQVMYAFASPNQCNVRLLAQDQVVALATRGNGK